LPFKCNLQRYSAGQIPPFAEVGLYKLTPVDSILSQLVRRLVSTLLIPIK
jgi:hypothetical protein